MGYCAGGRKGKGWIKDGSGLFLNGKGGEEWVSGRAVVVVDVERAGVWMWVCFRLPASLLFSASFL